MTVLLEKRRLIVSPGLAPTQLRREDKFGHPQHVDADLTIGLINNMPDTALQATERQFMRLLETGRRQHSHRFPLLLAAFRETVATGAVARRPAIHRHRRSRPPADRRIDRHRRRAGRRHAFARNRSGRISPRSSTGRRPTPVRPSGRVLPPMPRCCISTASSAGGSTPNAPGSTTASRWPTTG